MIQCDSSQERGFIFRSTTEIFVLIVFVIAFIIIIIHLYYNLGQDRVV